MEEEGDEQEQEQEGDDCENRRKSSVALTLADGDEGFVDNLSLNTAATDDELSIYSQMTPIIVVSAST